MAPKAIGRNTPARRALGFKLRAIRSSGKEGRVFAAAVSKLEKANRARGKTKPVKRTIGSWNA